MGRAARDLKAVMNVFLTPPTDPPDPTRVVNAVLCLSLFDDPNRTGRLAEIRRASHARTFQELTDFIAASDPSCADLLELSRDICVRKATIVADFERAWPEAWAER